MKRFYWVKNVKILCIMFAIASGLLLSGCAFSGLTPVQKSLAFGEELRLQYLTLHNEYLHLYNDKSTSDYLKERMSKYVAPALNKSKSAIVLYRDAVYIYAAYQEKPDNYDRLKEGAQSALQDAARLMLQITSKGGK